MIASLCLEQAAPPIARVAAPRTPARRRCHGAPQSPALRGWLLELKRAFLAADVRGRQRLADEIAAAFAPHP